MDYGLIQRLAEEIRASEDCRTYHRLRDELMADETLAALLREYRRLQMEIQMKALAGAASDEETMKRFSALAGLLFSKPEVSQFLLSEMRLQQSLAEIVKALTDAAGLDVQLPG